MTRPDRLTDAVAIPAALRLLLPSLVTGLARALVTSSPAELAARLAPELEAQLKPPLRRDVGSLLLAAGTRLQQSADADEKRA